MDQLNDDAIKTIGQYVGVLYGPTAYIHLAQTCKRMRRLLLLSPTTEDGGSGSNKGISEVGNQIVRHVIYSRVYHSISFESSSDTLHKPRIRYLKHMHTLEQLSIFEYWRQTTNFIHDNRIPFPFASTEIEADMQERIDQVVAIMKRYPNVAVELHSHCGTVAPSGIGQWFSRARGLSVRNTICDIDNNSVRGDCRYHIANRPINPNRVDVVGWGKRVAKIVSRLDPNHLPDGFVNDAREGKGWVEVYFHVRGADGNDAMLPPLPQYYDEVEDDILEEESETI